MKDFHTELTNLINCYSLENESNTPDWLLATYILQCLETFNFVVNAREKWYGRGVVSSTTEIKPIHFLSDEFPLGAW